jgi:hypothetical protein
MSDAHRAKLYATKTQPQKREANRRAPPLLLDLCYSKTWHSMRICLPAAFTGIDPIDSARA